MAEAIAGGKEAKVFGLGQGRWGIGAVEKETLGYLVVSSQTEWFSRGTGFHISTLRHPQGSPEGSEKPELPHKKHPGRVG